MYNHFNEIKQQAQKEVHVEGKIRELIIHLNSA
jgi:hypothetical protein